LISAGAIRLLNLGPTAWARTQSVYRATAELFPPDSPGVVIFAQSLQPYLSHGAQQPAEDVFDLAVCARLGLPVVRRSFPGGAEYCDVTHLLFQWILPSDEAERIAAAVVSALNAFGVPARFQEGRFCVQGARIGTLSGGPLGRSARVWLGSLYFNYDPRILTQTLRAPQAEAVTSLWAEAPRPLSPEMTQTALVEHFARAMGRPIERDTPRAPETHAARRIEADLLGIRREELAAEG
jgi:lipoate-protein ligase A